MSGDSGGAGSGADHPQEGEGQADKEGREERTALGSGIVLISQIAVRAFLKGGCALNGREAVHNRLRG